MTFKATNGLNLSNFLLPSAWVPGAAGPWDYMQVLAAQLGGSNEVTMMSMKTMVDRKLGREEIRSGNEDAMNYLTNTKPVFSKKEKIAWARKMRNEELLRETGRPEPEWMRDSGLLPKAPPGRVVV